MDKVRIRRRKELVRKARGPSGVRGVTNMRAWIYA
jgi:hypothetical protein